MWHARYQSQNRNNRGRNEYRGRADDLSCGLFSHTFFGGDARNKNGSGNGK